MLAARRRFLADAAHQIRTPLSAAMLYAANLANRTLKPESRSQFQQKLMARLPCCPAQAFISMSVAKTVMKKTVACTTQWYWCVTQH